MFDLTESFMAPNQILIVPQGHVALERAHPVTPCCDPLQNFAQEIARVFAKEAMRWADDGAEGPIERSPSDAGNDFDIRISDFNSVRCRDSQWLLDVAGSPIPG